MNKLILILFLIIPTSAFACDSFDDCLEQAENFNSSTFGRRQEELKKRGELEYTQNVALIYYVKSIIYKLDYISKKFNYPIVECGDVNCNSYNSTKDETPPQDWKTNETN